DHTIRGAVRAAGFRSDEHARRGRSNRAYGARAGMRRHPRLPEARRRRRISRSIEPRHLRSFAPLRMTLCCIFALASFACASKPVAPPDSEQFLPPDVEAISLLGKPLTSPPLAPDVQKKREEELAQAQRDFDANPDSADAIIWLGRRTAYLGRYREAIGIFSEGIRKHPDDARMYRHRGHRYITVRRFRDAVKDLEFAALLIRGKPDEVEPDGQPNARNIPLGSLQSNIFYHLGLAYYLSGDD